MTKYTICAYYFLGLLITMTVSLETNNSRLLQGSGNGRELVREGQVATVGRELSMSLVKKKIEKEKYFFKLECISGEIEGLTGAKGEDRSVIDAIQEVEQAAEKYELAAEKYEPAVQEEEPAVQEEEPAVQEGKTNCKSCCQASVIVRAVCEAAKAVKADNNHTSRVKKSHGSDKESPIANYFGKLEQVVKKIEGTDHT